MFSKFDQQLDSSCKRNEQLFKQTADELKKPDEELMIEMGRQGKKIRVVDYIEQFKWDNVKFEMSKNLIHLGAKISGVQK